MMILANVCAAETLEEKRTLCIYRVHDQPDPEKMDVLRELSTGLKINLLKGEVITPHKFNQIIAAAKDTALAPAISDAILRCQARAVYSPENSGHYGLGLSRYAHFTSPIRRYSDLMVHRGLIAGLQLGNEAHETDFNKAAEICKHISLTEQRAAKAERRTIARMAASLLQEQTGAIVDTTITGVTNAGLFVSLDKEGAEGFVSRRSLPEDYYETDDFHLSLVGAYSRWHFTIGDKLQCRIEKVSSASGDIDLSWQAGGIQKMADRTSRKKRRLGKPHRAGKNRRSSR